MTKKPTRSCVDPGWYGKHRPPDGERQFKLGVFFDYSQDTPIVQDSDDPAMLYIIEDGVEYSCHRKTKLGFR